MELVVIPKHQFDALGCTLEELAVLEMLQKDPHIKRKDIVEKTGKSISSVKRVMDALQKKSSRE